MTISPGAESTPEAKPSQLRGPVPRFSFGGVAFVHAQGIPSQFKASSLRLPHSLAGRSSRGSARSLLTSGSTNSGARTSRPSSGWPSSSAAGRDDIRAPAGGIELWPDRERLTDIQGKQSAHESGLREVAGKLADQVADLRKDISSRTTPDDVRKIVKQTLKELEDRTGQLEYRQDMIDSRVRQIEELFGYIPTVVLVWLLAHRLGCGVDKPSACAPAPGRMAAAARPLRAEPAPPPGTRSDPPADVEDAPRPNSPKTGRSSRSRVSCTRRWSASWRPSSLSGKRVREHQAGHEGSPQGGREFGHAHLAGGGDSARHQCRSARTPAGSPSRTNSSGSTPPRSCGHSNFRG